MRPVCAQSRPAARRDWDTVSRTRRGERGVTIVELSVVLVIIAVLGVAAYPLLNHVLEVMTARGAAEQVASAIRQARQYAISRGQNFCVKFGPTPDVRYTIGSTSDSTAANCTLDAIPSTEQGAQTIGNGAAVVSPNNLSIIFDPVGAVKNQGAGLPAPDSSYVLIVTVATQPASCLSLINLTLYGGIRVSAPAPDPAAPVAQRC